MPKRGKLLKIRGKTAQWMAQATDVAMPKASQLILNFMGTKISYCNIVAKPKFYGLSKACSVTLLSILII